MHYISILSTLVTFVFAVAVFERYRRRKGTHLLLWGIGLVFYGLGTLSEAIMIFTFNEFVLKIWYLCGAMLTAAWLGEGTLHLLVRKPRVANIFTGILAGVSLLAAFLVLTAPISATAAAAFDLSAPVSGQYKEILVRSGLITGLTIILNLWGTITLVGGAIYSAYIFWRKRVLLDRMIGNILIAAGALMPAMAGALVGTGLADFLYLSEFVGVVLMYAGFLKATALRPVEAKEAVPASAG